MKRRPTRRSRHASRGIYALAGAYVFFCASIILAAGLVTVTGFMLPSTLPLAQGQATIPVATIQLTPDQKGLCRQIFFHNDSGRFEEGGNGKCRGLIPDELLAVTTMRSNRDAAIARAFRFR